MVFFILNFLLLFTIFVINLGCVNLKITDNEPVESKKIRFRLAQDSRFQQITSKNNYQVTLQNKYDGGIIAMESSCPSYKDDHFNIIKNSLTNPNIQVIDTPLVIDQRNSKQFQIEGFKEGIRFTVWLIQYEKFGCKQSLILLNQSQAFANNQDEFLKIINTVRVEP